MLLLTCLLFYILNTYIYSVYWIFSWSMDVKTLNIKILLYKYIYILCNCKYVDFPFLFEAQVLFYSQKYVFRNHFYMSLLPELIRSFIFYEMAFRQKNQRWTCDSATQQVLVQVIVEVLLLLGWVDALVSYILLTLDFGGVVLGIDPPSSNGNGVPGRSGKSV